MLDHWCQDSILVTVQQPPDKSVLKVDIKKYTLPQSKNQTIRTKINSFGRREREKILKRDKILNMIYDLVI